MFHKAIEVLFKNKSLIDVTFQDGSVRRFDVSTLFDEFPQMRALRKAALFKSGKLQGGYGIIWNDELDLSVEEIYQNGKLIENVKLPIAYCVGNAISLARSEAGLTQTELAKLSGIDQSDLSKIERGAANPSLTTLDKIAAALGKNIDFQLL